MTCDDRSRAYYIYFLLSVWLKLLYESYDGAGGSMC